MFEIYSKGQGIWLKRELSLNQIAKYSISGYQVSYSQFVNSVSKIRTPNQYPKQYAAIFVKNSFLQMKKVFTNLKSTLQGLYYLSILYQTNKQLLHTVLDGQWKLKSEAMSNKREV